MRTVRVGGHQQCMTDSNRWYTVAKLDASSGLYCIILIAINSYKKLLVGIYNAHETHFETAEGVVDRRKRVIDDTECSTSH
jgi:hypothetical protein